MQTYANVGTQPVRKQALSSGRFYWEFRAGESFRGDSDTTWYTVRLFREDDPGLKVGDFVCLTGKLHQDVFVNREGKPTGVLVLLAFSCSRIERRAKEDKADQAHKPDGGQRGSGGSGGAGQGSESEPDWVSLLS